MKILVTGGAGFIGKYLVKSLLEKDYLVTVFDNFSNSIKNSFLADIDVKIIDGDITRPLEILNAVKDQDVVIHLAAKISVLESISNPSDTFQVNVDGTKNILVACEKNHVKKLIVASSAAVYGESSPDVKLTEESNLKPISPYGESKVKMEQKIREFTSKYDIDCIILRFFNIYGIGQTKEYAGVITKFMEKITQDRPLEIFGDGLQTRDFVAIDDVVNSIHNSISLGKSGTYNIGSGKIITIKKLADMILSVAEKNLKIKYLEPNKGDIRHSQSDISLAKNNLEYHPKVKLEDGIKKLIKFR